MLELDINHKLKDIISIVQLFDTEKETLRNSTAPLFKIEKEKKKL